MSAPEDVAGVVQTAADEFKKMMDTLAEIFEKLQATEKAGKAANVQEGLLKAITDLKDEIVSLKEKPGLLSPGKVDEMAAKGADLQEAVLNPGDWQTALPGAGVPKMADGPLGNLMKGGPPGLPGLPGSEEGVPGLPDVPGLEEGGPGLPSSD
ncbi:MAG TPA: hypothetical protein VD994_19655, partial [Prosthecobacter sp.]|nr:hypothetical protein [Prosthecobacter sp.]